jgi:hypothetical protein
MKQQITLSLLLLFGLIACRKEIVTGVDPYLQKVQAVLKDSVTISDYMELDFQRAVLSKVDSAGLYYLRIPFKCKKLANDFVIVKTTRSGEIQKGKIVHLEGNAVENGEGKVRRRTFDGAVCISSLDRKTIFSSAIKNGFIEELHRGTNNLRLDVVPEEDVLPEVVVIAYVNDYSYSISYWYMLESYFYDSYDFGGGGDGGYYGSSDGSGGYYDGGGGYYSGDGGSSDPYGGVQQEQPILIDYETQEQNPSIDIQKFINCFKSIPDAGSTCSIEIFADIPVDSDPYKVFDFESGSPGHTFLQIKKSNGNQSVIQNIGFYPKDGLKTIATNAPIDGKFVDNGSHEFNASLKMNLSSENLNSTLTEILYLATFIKYDIDNYNCTDFALDVFNKTRVNKLEIPLYDIPGNYPSTGTRMPQGLYNKLKQMKDGKDPEAVNITIGIEKGWVATSTGPCN